MITERDLLTSAIITVILTATLTLIHSETVLWYTFATCSAAGSVYLSFLAHTYKKKYSQVSLFIRQNIKRDKDLSGGWWTGWFFLVAALVFLLWGLSSQWTSPHEASSIYYQAMLSGIVGFIGGFGYSFLFWWLWRKYMAAIKHLT